MTFRNYYIVCFQELLNVAGSDSEDEDEYEGKSESIKEPPAKKLKAKEANPAATKKKRVLFADGVAPGSKEAAIIEAKEDIEEKSNVEETGGKDIDKDNSDGSVSSDDEDDTSKCFYGFKQ